MEQTKPMATKVLVIGSDAALRELYQEILHDEGFSVTTWRTFGRGVDAVAQLAPDLILLDALVTPGCNEWLLLQRLKTYPATAAIPVIVCTTTVRETEKWYPCFQSKGVSILLKPFEIDHLLTTVRGALGGFPVALPFSTWRQTRPHLLH